MLAILPAVEHASVTLCFARYYTMEPDEDILALLGTSGAVHCVSQCMLFAAKEAVNTG